MCEEQPVGEIEDVDWMLETAPNQPEPDTSWYDQFEQLFFGNDVNQNQDVSYVNQDQDVSYVNQNQDISYVNQPQDISYVNQNQDISYVNQPRDISFVEEQEDCGTTNEVYDTPYQEEIIYQEQPLQEQVLDMYNTDQCIHTYNIVNTIEEVSTKHSPD